MEEVSVLNPVSPISYHQLDGLHCASSHGKSGWLSCWNHIPDVIFLGTDYEKSTRDNCHGWILRNWRKFWDGCRYFFSVRE